MHQWMSSSLEQARLEHLSHRDPSIIPEGSDLECCCLESIISLGYINCSCINEYFTEWNDWTPKTEPSEGLYTHRSDLAAL
jgi:hypothetical protein